ncbi:MAG TPA: GPW/gp25 family protein [Pyrinomonadaceae bacterium]|nr:GPW/gp25 family protein [Pyrinomonadaceae bacterium]
MDTTGLAFPFTINNLGRVATLEGDDRIRAKIIQVLLTAPGERVNLPEFGCGLRELVFDPNNEILAATTEFAVSKALVRWLGDEIIVEQVDINSGEERLELEVVYVRRDRLETGRVKIAF